MTRCAHCGYRADPGEAECPLCGSTLDAGDAPEDERRERPAPAGTGSAATGGPAAWDRDGGRVPDDLIRAWRESVFSPTEFFDDLRPGGSLARAVLYYLAFVLVGAALSVFWNLTTGGVGEAGGLYEMVGLTAARAQLLGFLAAPFLALFFLGFFAVAYHLLVLLLVQDHRGVRETARVIAYAWSGPQLFQAVPVVGGVVALVWSLVLMVVGIREQHGTSTGRAAAVVLIPALLSVGVPVVLLVVALAMGVAGGAFPTP